MGIPIEHEHTHDEDLAKDIALQHLGEIPDYYSRLKKMELDAKRESKSLKNIKEHCGCEDKVVSELESRLKKLNNISYDSIDKLMRRIMKKHDLTAKQLHNAFVDKHKKTPDDWIKELKEGTLHHWFKGSKSKDGKPGWVQADGSPCANEPGETKTPKCFSSGRLNALKRKGKKGESLIRSAVRRKRNQDKGQQQKSGGAKPTMVATFSKGKNDPNYVKAEPTIKEAMELYEAQKDSPGQGSGKKDACYYKVKSRYDVWPSAYACVPEHSTKALTRDSWKGINELSISDEILTYNIETNQLEFKPILNLHRYKNIKTKVIQSENSEFIFECTDNHKWVIKFSNENSIHDRVLIETQDLLNNNKNIHLVVTAPYDGILKLKDESLHQNSFLLSTFLNCGIVTWKKNKSGDIHSCKSNINKRFEDASNFKLIKENISDVWCPETENKTWVMLQETGENGIITITGNSGALVKCRKAGAKNWGTKTEEVQMMKYCPKCKKSETRDECRYGPKFWDSYAIDLRKYTPNTPHPGNFPESYVNPTNRVLNGNKTFEEFVIEASTAAWQRKEGKNESGGLNQKGVESYRRENPGSKLKTAVTTDPSKLKKGSKSWKRRKSFCSRSAGQMKMWPKAAKDPNSRLRLARRKWNC